MKRALAVLLLAALAGVAMPARAFSVPEGWIRLGAGEMRWFGLRLYQASLWSSKPVLAQDQPFALSLTYARSISSIRIVEASIEEMRRLGVSDESKLAKWQGYMQKAFPDVREGDCITGVSLPGGVVQFWFGERLNAEIPDAEFARAFFAIWLDPRTREPGLRARLLGQT